MPDDLAVTITRRVEAPPARLWKAWSSADGIARWFGPRDSKVVSAEADLRVGGRYRIVLEAPDGRASEVGGAYREIVPNERLAFTWAWKATPDRVSLVTVTLAVDGAGTLLTLRHEKLTDEEARRRHESGWIQSLDSLEASIGQP
jgi:uncharacterized protein YndB with AHSA1/START domain